MTASGSRQNWPFHMHELMVRFAFRLVDVITQRKQQRDVCLPTLVCSIPQPYGLSILIQILRTCRQQIPESFKITMIEGLNYLLKLLQYPSVRLHRLLMCLSRFLTALVIRRTFRKYFDDRGIPRSGVSFPSPRSASRSEATR